MKMYRIWFRRFLKKDFSSYFFLKSAIKEYKSYILLKPHMNDLFK